MASLSTVAAYALWPLCCVAFGYGVAAAVRVWGGLGLAAAPAGIVIVLLAIERLLPRRRDRAALGDPQLPNDIAHGFLADQLGNRIGEVLFLGAASAAAAGLAGRLGTPLWPAHWPVAAQGCLLVVLADGLEYWRHRLMHGVPWLWPIHALHHSVDRLHAVKGGRNNFVDLLLRTAMVYAPLLTVGVPREILLWYPAALFVLGPIAHANLALRFPSLLHRVLVTPPEHLLHHARDQRLANANFAVVLPLWDIVFGTFRHPDDHPIPEVGIEHDPIPPRFLPQFVAPFVWPRLVRAERAGTVAAGGAV